VRELVAELIRAYAAAGLECGRELLPPADDHAIRSVEEALSVPVPPELRELWLIHGGQRYFGAGTKGLFGRHRLHAPAEVPEKHRLLWDNAVLDVPKWGRQPEVGEPPVPEQIPFASWDWYTLLIYPADGTVWEFSPNMGLRLRRPSITAVLRELLGLVQSGAELRLVLWDGPAEQGASADPPRE
jgi:SMI1 / KNR4 family (SUKH-1)